MPDTVFGNPDFKILSEKFIVLQQMLISVVSGIV